MSDILPKEDILLDVEVLLEVDILSNIGFLLVEDMHKNDEILCYKTGKIAKSTLREGHARKRLAALRAVREHACSRVDHHLQMLRCLLCHYLLKYHP